jgi:uncharacterized protein involved in outer membrane biogenesis
MKGWLLIRRWLAYMGMALTALLLIAVALAAALDAGFFRGPVIRFLAARAGRQIEVAGIFEPHLLSWTPRLTAGRVTIGNPAWVPAGTTAQLERVLVTIRMPGFGHWFSIGRLEMDGATLHLRRDAAGHANWQWTDPDQHHRRSLLIIHSLSMPSAHVLLDDARRHLAFDGLVSAQDQVGTAGVQPLQIRGAGQLNGKPATFEITGDALATASHQKPYHFTFAGSSSGSRLTGQGLLAQTFNFDRVDASFAAEGADLKDLYFLTGVTLVDTGGYHLSGTVARRGTNTRFSDLVAASGQSDMHGTVSIESSSGRPELTADLDSEVLRLGDIGARAAGREPETGAPHLLLSDAMLKPEGVRRGDATVNFRARRVEMGRMSLHAVSANMTINQGMIIVSPLLAQLFEGRLNAHLKIDATTDNPTARFDLRIADLQLAQIERKGTGQPPFEGSLQARVTLSGRGRSIHQVASTADGTVSAVVPHGAVRTALAELSGIDLGGLGRLIAGNKQEAAIRCGVASFQARGGTLTAQTLVVDTDPILITGEGAIHFDSEALDLAFRGHPKKPVLLRLRSPVLVRGTLSHPSIDIKAANSVAQAAEAIALGVVLTPLAAVLAFVDPGLAKDADCAALSAAAKIPQTSRP